jgi:hypothetical protein
MRAITERPSVGVITVGPPATPAPHPAASHDEPGDSGFRFARGAMIGTVLALFPWSLLILLVGWLVR